MTKYLLFRTSVLEFSRAQNSKSVKQILEENFNQVPSGKPKSIGGQNCL